METVTYTPGISVDPFYAATAAFLGREVGTRETETHRKSARWCFNEPTKIPNRTSPIPFTVVMDIDETLLHADQLCLVAHIRPHARAFLHFVASLGVEVILWSAGVRSHVQWATRVLDPKRRIVSYAICRGDWFESEKGAPRVKCLKDLAHRRGTAIIIDDLFHTAIANPGRSILAYRYFCGDDSMMIYASRFVAEIAKAYCNASAATRYIFANKASAVIRDHLWSREPSYRLPRSRRSVLEAETPARKTPRRFEGVSHEAKQYQRAKEDEFAVRLHPEAEPSSVAADVDSIYYSYEASDWHPDTKKEIAYSRGLSYASASEEEKHAGRASVPVDGIDCIIRHVAMAMARRSLPEDPEEFVAAMTAQISGMSRLVTMRAISETFRTHRYIRKFCPVPGGDGAMCFYEPGYAPSDAHTPDET